MPRPAVPPVVVHHVGAAAKPLKIKETASCCKCDKPLVDLTPGEKQWLEMGNELVCEGCPQW